MRQARIEGAHLRELHLDSRLVRSCVLRENIKDELPPVDDLSCHDLLDIPYLARRKGGIDDKRRCPIRLHHRFDLFEFALSHEG
jgi:hypothetical protein